MTGIDPLRGARVDLPATGDRATPPRNPAGTGLSGILGDAFRVSEPSAQAQEQLRGTAQPVRTVENLHPSLNRVTHADEIPARFGADFALVFDQLLHPALILGEGLTRLWAFFGDYAEKFVALRPEAQAAQTTQHPSGETPGQEASVRIPLSPELTAAFAKVLREAGFARIADRVTDRDALSVALDLLAAPTVAEARRLANNVQWVLVEGPDGQPIVQHPPQAPHPEGADARDAAHDIADAQSDARLRARPAPPGLMPFLRSRLWPDDVDPEERTDFLFWAGVVVLSGFAVIGALLRWLL